MRGRVAASYMQNMVLGRSFQEARKTVAEYGTQMPESWVTHLMRLGHRCGWAGWRIACGLLFLREYQKSLWMAVHLKISGLKQ